MRTTHLSLTFYLQLSDISPVNNTPLEIMFTRSRDQIEIATFCALQLYTDTKLIFLNTSHSIDLGVVVPIVVIASQESPLCTGIR